MKKLTSKIPPDHVQRDVVDDSTVDDVGIFSREVTQLGFRSLLFRPIEINQSNLYDLCKNIGNPNPSYKINTQSKTTTTTNLQSLARGDSIFHRRKLYFMIPQCHGKVPVPLRVTCS